MKLKVTYGDETHRIANIPDTLQSLTSLISDIFLSILPPQWELEYNDLDGNKMTLATEKDYKELTTNKPGSSNAGSILRVFIVAKELAVEPKIPPLVVIENEVPLSFEKFEEKTTVLDDKMDFAPLITSQNLKYLLREEDWLTESKKPSDQDFEDLIDKAIEKRIPKIASMTQDYISESSHKPRSDNDNLNRSTNHMGVTCSGCRATPISGIRYRCSICPSFDYCERCESSKEHPHALIKIRSPDQPYSHPSATLIAPPPLPFIPFMSPFMSHPPPFMSPPSFMQPPHKNHNHPPPPFIGHPPMNFMPMQMQNHCNPNNMNQRPDSGMPFFRFPGPYGSPLRGHSSESSDDGTHTMMGMAARGNLNAEAFGEKKMMSQQNEEMGQSKKEKTKPARKSYSKGTIKIARCLKQLMPPNTDYDLLLEFVDGSPKDIDILELLPAFELYEKANKL